MRKIANAFIEMKSAKKKNRLEGVYTNSGRVMGRNDQRLNRTIYVLESL